MGKRATRRTKAGEGIRDLEVDALKAENLHLKEEIERLRLRNAGAHPAAALADALQSSDEAGDSADDALTMYASSMVIRSEMTELLALFKATIEDYERRLETLAEGPVTGAHAADDLATDTDDLRSSTHQANEVHAVDEADDTHEAIEETVTIDLRDPDDVAFVTGPHHYGAAHDHEADEDSAPQAKGA